MIILTGVAGSGKSTQGRLFADVNGYAWISTGELFRVLVTGERRQQMLEGKLLSDNEVIALIDRSFKLIDLNQEFVVDGFPRTKIQADWLLDQVKAGRMKLTAIFNLSASSAVVTDRLLKRGRQDDTTEAIKQRFVEHETMTKPIIDYFRQAGAPVYDIDGEGDPVTIHEEIMTRINGK